MEFFFYLNLDFVNEKLWNGEWTDSHRYIKSRCNFATLRTKSEVRSAYD